MDVGIYLERIGIAGPLVPDSAMLRNLHVAHLRSVPFENLSIELREPVRLDDGALFTKIIKQRRGGFCYELNGLFAALLRKVGYEVEMLSAQVMGSTGAYGPPFDHMMLRVNLEEAWLVDVGFGDSFSEPLRLADRTPIHQLDSTYQIEESCDQFILTRKRHGKEGQPQYRFDLQPFEYTDFIQMCDFHQTSPTSPFTQRRICTVTTSTGRNSISGMRLTVARGSHREQTQLRDRPHLDEVLLSHFGIALKKEKA